MNIFSRGFLDQGNPLQDRWHPHHRTKVRWDVIGIFGQESIWPFPMHISIKEITMHRGRYWHHLPNWNLEVQWNDPLSTPNCESNNSGLRGKYGQAWGLKYTPQPWYYGTHSQIINSHLSGAAILLPMSLHLWFTPKPFHIWTWKDQLGAQVLGGICEGGFQGLTSK